MTAAPPVPATRKVTPPWHPWCWLEVQISTATGAGGDPDRVGYWQPDTPVTTDPRYTVWQADGVTIPPAGTPPPSGWGEWVGDSGAKHNRDWSLIPWQSVDCELMAATFQTGGDPWEWNAPPGNGSLTLHDPDHIFTPLGPGSGKFDDIGIDTPIRVVAHLTAAFDEYPANAAKRLPDRVLITGVIRSIEHTIPVGGPAQTVIAFSEPHVLYSRVNVPETALPATDLDGRLDQITALSDDPATQLVTTWTADMSLYDGRPGGLSVLFGKTANALAAGTVSADLWTEICKAINSQGMVTVLGLYQYNPYGGQPDPTIGSPLVTPLSPFNHYGQTGNAPNRFGYDTRTVTTTCSPPSATFNHTNSDDAGRRKLTNSPLDGITLGHSTDDIANDVSIAATGGTAYELTDPASIDRWYLHSYQRHDLVFRPDYDIGNGRNIAEQIAWRVLERLKGAVHNIAECSYFIGEPRDFDFAVGSVTSYAGGARAHPYADHPPLEPGRWLKLVWGFVNANLRLTRLQHSITPYEWRVTHSYEVHNPTAPTATTEET